MKSKENYELRELFLREFTRHLILNSIPKEKNIQKTNEEKRHTPLVQNNRFQEKMIASPMTRIAPDIMPIQKEYISQMVKPLHGYSDLKKLNILISDPRINQIDCHGPNKEILVKISGTTQKTKTILTKEEIIEIIKEFSDKTRIPLIKGVFRAALGNLILTATISDFVDTRFTIQKRTPFQQQI